MTLDMTALNGVVAAPPERTLAAHQGRLARPKHTVPASQWIRKRDVMEDVGQWPHPIDCRQGRHFASAVTRAPIEEAGPAPPRCIERLRVGE
jgi:hypothetical protein